MTGSAKGFDFNSLFRSGSVIGQVSYQNGRTGTMSIKMYTVHENGELVNKIGIFDITNQSNTVGQMFPISAQHSRQTFALDDRVPGMTKYTLTFVPNGNDTMISFGRPGNSRPITTSVSALYNLRAQQALTEGSIATIGDKQYYVLGQSAARGSLLFFPSDLKDRMAAGGDLSPDLVADVNRRAADGRGQNLPYTEGRSLWTAYGTAAPYHLEFDPKEGCWEVKAGSGDPDPDPAYSRKAGGDQTGGAWSDAGGTPSGSDAIKPATLQSIRNYLRAGGNEPDPIGQDFRSDLKKKDIEIWTYTKSGKPPLGYWHFWIVPAKLYAARNMPMPAPPDVPLGEKADELRLIDGHIVAITQSYATLYFDLERPLTVEMKDGRPQNLPFEQVGQVGKSSFHIADAALLKSALDLSKFPLHGKTCPDVESSLKAVMKNRLQGEDYAITGGMDSGTLAIHFGGNRLFGKFWPKSDEKLDSAAGHVDDRGPGNAFDFDSGPKDNELSDDLFVGPAEHVKTAATAKDGHSAKLYLNDAGSRMYFAFKLSLDGGKTANFSGYQLAFAKEPKDLQLPFPAVAVRDIHVRGLTAASVPSPKSRSLGDRKSGLVYAVYNDTLSSSAPGTIDPGPNCAGPLIWWGMEEKTAWADCKKDSP
jgi:hypothetical protein